MDAPNPHLLVHDSGKRLRKFEDTNDWLTPKMRPLRELLRSFASAPDREVDVLRQLIVDVGAAHAGSEILHRLTSEHVPLFWRGYYGGLLPESSRVDRIQQS